MKFNNVKLADLQVMHSEMCATAHDMKLKVPAELSVEIKTEVQGVPICEKLHAMIEEARQKTLASGDGKAQGDAPKSRDVSSGPETTKRMAAQKAARQAKGTSAPAKPAAPKKGTAATGEEPVVKKAKKSAKKAKPAKKAAGEKISRTKFAGDKKVTWIAKENPAREGSARFDRYAKLQKCTGKTVEACIKAGVPTATLANAEAAKVITIK